MSSFKPARRIGPLQLVLLAIPCIAVLAVPLFNRIEPTLAGIPFFYWWQLLWVPLTSVVLGVVYVTVVPPEAGD